MATQALADSGFGTITLSAQGDVSLDTGSGLTLGDHSSLALQSATGKVALAGNVTDHAGSVNLTSAYGGRRRGRGRAGRPLRPLDQPVPGRPARRRLGHRRRQLRRARRARRRARRGLAGRRLGRRHGHAGRIARRRQRGRDHAAGRPHGPGQRQSPATRRRSVSSRSAARCVARPCSRRPAPRSRCARHRCASARAPSGAAPASLTFTPDFFTRGGFSSYSLDGLAFLDVSAGTTIAPTRTSWWTPDSSYQRAATGSRIGDVLASGASPLALAPTVRADAEVERRARCPGGRQPCPRRRQAHAGGRQHDHARAGIELHGAGGEPAAGGRQHRRPRRLGGAHDARPGRRRRDAERPLARLGELDRCLRHHARRALDGRPAPRQRAGRRQHQPHRREPRPALRHQPGRAGRRAPGPGRHQRRARRREPRRHRHLRDPPDAG